MKKISFILIALASFIGVSAQAASGHDVVKQLLAKYAADAREEALKAGETNPKPISFSVDAGRAFYLKRRTWSKGDLSCSSCHTDNPVNQGKNIETQQPIDPLALSKNPHRFTSAKKVEQNFSKHCIALWGRDCSAQDKGDFLTYLTWVK